MEKPSECFDVWAENERGRFVAVACLRTGRDFDMESGSIIFEVQWMPLGSGDSWVINVTRTIVWKEILKRSLSAWKGIYLVCGRYNLNRIFDRYMYSVIQNWGYFINRHITGIKRVRCCSLRIIYISTSKSTSVGLYGYLFGELFSNLLRFPNWIEVESAGERI